MPHHKSAKKRVRQSAAKRLHNRYYKKSMRTSVKKLRLMKDHSEASTFLPEVISKIDKLAKTNQLHKNKAGNLKSKLTRFVNSLVS